MSKLVRTDQPRTAQPLPSGRRGYLVRGSIAPVFVERGALSPPDAIPFKPATTNEAKAFAALRRAGAIRQAGANWWLDIVAYQADAHARSRRAVPYLIAGSVALAFLLTLFYAGGG